MRPKSIVVDEIEVFTQAGQVAILSTSTESKFPKGLGPLKSFLNDSKNVGTQQRTNTFDQPESHQKTQTTSLVQTESNANSEQTKAITSSVAVPKDTQAKGELVPPNVGVLEWVEETVEINHTGKILVLLSPPQCYIKMPGTKKFVNTGSFTGPNINVSSGPIPGIETVQVYCLDDAGQRLPLDEAAFFEASRTVSLPLSAPVVNEDTTDFVEDAVIRISSPDASEVRYTTDGTEVLSTSALYSYDEPPTLTATSLVKARAFRAGFKPSAEGSTIINVFPKPVLNHFAWAPPQVNVGQSSTLSWEIQHVKECQIVGVNGLQPAVGTIGPLVQSAPKVEKSQMTCVDMAGGRFPVDPNVFLEAELQVSTGTEYLIKTQVGEGGSISPTEITVAGGTSPEFIISPHSGYIIANVSGCGGTLNGSTYKTGSIAASCTVSANFTKNVTAQPETPLIPMMAAVPEMTTIGHDPTAGVIKGDFQVSTSGAATYHIPLALPSGIAGTTPQIGFSYNSQSGNGPLGVGWQVSGLSGVSRCRKTLAEDGFFAAIKFNQQDAICLDGSRLVLTSGTEWTDQAIYHTKIENMQRIRLLHVAGKIQFAVDRSDGSTYFYGQTSDSVQQDQQSGQIYKWHLSAITDASGNRIKFSYINAEHHQAYLNKIEYSGHSVDFVYDSLRADKKSGYFQGNKFIANLRLNEVVITNQLGNAISSYYLQYNQSINTGASLLNVLQQCNGKKENVGGQCLKTTFAHDESKYSPMESLNINLADFVDDKKIDQIKTADINGDAKDDYIISYRADGGSKIKVILSDWGNYRKLNDFSAPAVGNFILKDIDGDGLSEILVRHYDGISETETIYRWQGPPSGGELVAEAVSAEVKSHGEYGADIDGNGLPDRAEYQQRWLNKNNQWQFIEGFDSFQLLDFLGYEDFDTNGGNTRVSHEIISDETGGNVDFNADGIPDMFNVTLQTSITVDNPMEPDCAGTNICRLKLIYDAVSVGINDNGVYISGNLGNFGYSDELSNTGPVPSYVFPDINGDGNADVFDNSASLGTQNQGLLKGVGLASEAVVPPPYRLFSWYADVNMDGADDYIFKPEGHGATGLYYKTFDSITNEWSADIPLPNSTDFASKIVGGRQNVSFADINGDGLFDYSVVDLDNRTISLQYGVEQPHNYNQNYTIDLITSINVSDAKKINVEYMSSTGQGYSYCSGEEEFHIDYEVVCVYVDGKNEKLPAGAHGAAVLNLRAPQYLVKKYYEFDHNAEQNNFLNTSYKTYQYKGFRVQAGGTGSLGFESIFIHDEMKNTITISDYYQQFPFSGILKKQKVYLSRYFENGYDDETKLLSEYQVDELTDISLHGGKTRFISVGRSQATEYTIDFVNGSMKSTHTRVKATASERKFTKYSDAYVNVTSEITNTTDETTLSTYNVTTVSEYDNENVNKWWIGKPTKKIVTHQRTGDYTSGNNIARTMGYTYYAGNGLLETEVIEPDGDASTYLKTHFSYDEFGNKTAVTQCSFSFASQCDAASLPSTLTQTTDIFRRTKNIYDSEGRYLKEIQQSGLTSQYFDSYNMLGQPTSVRQLLNNASVQTDIFYDDFGTEYFRRSADGSAVSSAIARNDGDGPQNAAYQITVLSNVAPATKQYVDITGKTLRASTQSFDGRWINVDAKYNDQQLKVSESVPYFSDEAEPAGSEFEYDLMHRLIRQTAADSTVITFEYVALATNKTVKGNYASKLVNWSASINRTSSSISNAFGDKVKVVDEHGQELSFSYDAVGNADLLTGVDGVQINPEFDSYGRRTALKDPNKGDWFFSYNGLGELVETNAPDGIKTKEYRDNLGRVQLRTVTKGNSVETSRVVYQGQKLTEQYIEGGPLQGFGYDALGRLNSTSTTIDSLTFTSSKTYDEFGRTFQHFDASGQSRGLRYGYNSYGYLEFMREAAAGVDGQKYYEVYAMDERGNVVSSQAGNGLTTLRSFDQKTGFIKDIQTGLLGQVQSLAYEFDGVGNLRARIDYNNLDITNTTQSLYEEFEYDDLNRLTKSKRNLSGNLVTTQQMSYSHNGNILTKSDLQAGATYDYQDKPSVCSSASLVGGHSVQKIGQLSYCYDGRGNQTHSFDNNVQQRVVEYSHFDLPEKITSLTGSTRFVYNVQRERIKRIDTENSATTTTYYLGNVEYIQQPNGSNEFKRYLGNFAIEIVRSNGTRELSYLHQDHLGSLDVISNSSGQKTQCLSFDAFGKRRQCSGWNPVSNAFTELSLGNILAITPRGFTGHEHIDHAEVIHMNGRIYDPKNGRFMQADPIVQAPDHSQSPNRYSYVFNNPLSYTDPTGFEAYVLNPWSDWLPIAGDWLSTMYAQSLVIRSEINKLKLLDRAYTNDTPADLNGQKGNAKPVDQQQTGPTGQSDGYLGRRGTNEDQNEPSSNLVWEKQPGATDDDVAEAKRLWELGKTRRLKDGSVPKSAQVLIDLENSDKTTTIRIGENGNSAEPTDGNWEDALNSDKGANPSLIFNPYKKGSMGGGIERSPEASLVHEAFHALEISKGALSKTNFRQTAEVGATSLENWHRKAMGLPQRTKYGDWDVPTHEENKND